MSILFSLSLHHEYFDGNVLRDIDARPDKITARTISRFGLLFRQQPGVLTLMGGQSLSMGYLASATNGHPLVFELFGDGHRLYTISEFPTTWCGQLCFSSRYCTAKGETYLMQTRFLPAQPGEQSVGRIEFYPSDLDKLPGANYTIQIAARQAAWNYYIFNRSQRTLTAPCVRSERGFEFSNHGEVRIGKQGAALHFSSDSQTFAMSQTPSERNRLVNRSTSKPSRPPSESTLVKALPAAAPERVHLTSPDDARPTHCDMYVYI